MILPQKSKLNSDNITQVARSKICYARNHLPTVGAVTGLLVVCTVQGIIMCKRQILRERLRFEGFKMPFLAKI